MSQADARAEIARKPVVFQLPNMGAVKLRRDVKYASSATEELSMDIYYPPDSKSGAQPPVAIIVAGYSDFRTPNVIGCKFKEMEWTISWARLLAASGVAAITYSPREPETDLQALLEFCRGNSAELGIDMTRTGVLAASGNVPNALSLMMREGAAHLKAAVLCCGFTLDPEGSTVVSDAAKLYGFVNPTGKSIEDLPLDVPLFIVRAGREQFPGLNDALDRFVASAVKRNMPVTFLNHATGVHGFELFEDNEESRVIIKQILEFMASRLFLP
jgi:hypothetical protein